MPVTRRNVRRRCDRNSIVTGFEKADLFGVPVKFNYDGKSQIKSTPGAILSIFFLMVLGAFALQRF